LGSTIGYDLVDVLSGFTLGAGVRSAGGGVTSAANESEQAELNPARRKSVPIGIQNLLNLLAIMKKSWEVIKIILFDNQISQNIK